MAPLFENRVAIVTGSGQGVGKATGLLLASHGAQVVFNDWVRFELAQKTAEALGPDCAIAIKADMTTVEGTRRLVEGALKQFRRIDILVNNIGADSAKSKDIDLTEDDWDRSMDVNLRTTFLGCRAAAPYM